MKHFAPAKINLYLHILGRRTDGFHELETLMVPLDFGDWLEVELQAAGLAFSCSDRSLARAEDNLATRAAHLFLKEFKLTIGVRIHLEKQIPIGAGLGGGSSDAAAVLLSLRRLTGLEISDEQLAELAGRLGSDVPFFIQAKPAVCRGRGEIIEPISLSQPLSGLLVHPGFGVATAWAYQTYAKTRLQGIPGKSSAGFTPRNDFEPVVFAKYLWLPAAKAWLQSQSETVAALMSGSGSSLFALVATPSAGLVLRDKFRREFGRHLFAQVFNVA